MNDFFKNKGISSARILHVSPREAYELCQQDSIIVDVREDYMGRHKVFDVEELIFCPRSILEDTYVDLPKNKSLIFADAVGLRSKEAVEFLLELGSRNIANMASGIGGWERDGFPLVIDLLSYLRKTGNELSFEIQISTPTSLRYDKATQIALNKLKALPKQNLITHKQTLNKTQYQNLFPGAICLLIYDHKSYHDKFSGVALDAFYAGCPVITATNTFKLS